MAITRRQFLTEMRRAYERGQHRLGSDADAQLAAEAATQYFGPDLATREGLEHWLMYESGQSHVVVLDGRPVVILNSHDRWERLRSALAAQGVDYRAGGWDDENCVAGNAMQVRIVSINPNQL